MDFETYAKGKKPDTKEQLLCDPFYLQCQYPLYLQCSGKLSEREIKLMIARAWEKEGIGSDFFTDVVFPLE